jgi:hypothetical protein
VEQGYTVRACVRDVASEAKTAHLLALNGADHRGADLQGLIPIVTLQYNSTSL